MISLDKINHLKNQGKSDQEIIGILREQGNNPRDIVEGLNQLRIKNAVNPGNQIGEPGMSPSIMTDDENSENQVPIPSSNQDVYTPQSQQQNPQQGYDNPYNQQQNYPENSQDYYSEDPYSPQSNSQDYYNQDQNYQDNSQNYYSGGNSEIQDSYEQYEGYSQQYESTDTIIEIAEQVFSEKTREFEKQLREVMQFKTVYEQRINDMNERIKRIEKYFDKMQLAIMEKVTMFGQNIENLQKEINMVEDSFSKVVDPLTNKNSNSHKTSHKK